MKNHSTATYICLCRTLFANSSLLAILTIGLLFTLIPTTTSATTSPAYVSTTSGGILSTYSGSLSLSSPVFAPPEEVNIGNYYYQAIRITVSTSGRYIFRSSSSIDTFGYLYNNTFDPSYPHQNLITSHDDNGNSGRVRISVDLQSQYTYVLVVTTFNPADRGIFSITVFGPASVNLISFIPTTSRPLIIGTTTTTRISSTYSDYLSSSGAAFFRPGNSIYGYYYYKAIRVTISTSGRYTFTSRSSIDTYGYFYYDPIDPSYPSQNLITSNDDGGSGRQFRISVDLQSRYTYVLIVTTFSVTTTGTFSIDVDGPARVSMTSFTLSTSRPIRTTTTYRSCSGSSCSTDRSLTTIRIIGISFASVSVFITLVSVCIRQSNRKTVSTRRTTPSIQNRNTSRSNGIPSVHTVSMSPPSYVEEPPPAYDLAVITSKKQNESIV